MNQKLKDLLLNLRDKARRNRFDLRRRGLFSDRDVRDMESDDLDHVRELQSIIDIYGWPGFSLVGEEGAESAWYIAQNADALPSFQRSCLRLIREAVEHGEASPKHAAMLMDRVRFNERKPQIFGTIFDWDQDDQLNPWPIEPAEGVDARRAKVGLPPLMASIREIRQEAEQEGHTPPGSYEERQSDIDGWAKRVGWL